jgi:hypothetical protein
MANQNYINQNTSWKKNQERIYHHYPEQHLAGTDLVFDY